jgi:hypothetical protein
MDTCKVEANDWQNGYYLIEKTGFSKSFVAKYLNSHESRKYPNFITPKHSFFIYSNLKKAKNTSF